MTQTTQSTAHATAAPEGVTAATPAPEATPGSPEHKAAMMAAYDAQFAKPVPDVITPPAAAATAPLTDEAKPAETDTPPAEAPTPPDAPEEGDKPALASSLGDLFADGTFVAGFNAEKIPESLSKGLEAAGLKAEQIAAIHETFRAGQAAVQALAVQKLHVAAGGKEAFDGLVAWGQKNLTPAQQTYFDEQFNGPMAADALAVLKQRATAGNDPRLVQVSTNANPPSTSYRDSSEMQAAMRDPRYATSPAFRNEVRERLRYSSF